MKKLLAQGLWIERACSAQILTTLDKEAPWLLIVGWRCPDDPECRGHRKLTVRSDN